MNPIVNTAVKAARRAGAIIARHVDQLDRVRVERKGRNDFVSEIDRRAEDEIIDILQTAYPDFGFLAEESGHHEGKDDGKGYQWIIDPLDGTTNFIHGYPQFAVSIALAKDNVLQHGVIFDPLKDELFTATRGQGAQLNSKRIRVSEIHLLNDALLGTGFPFSEMDNLDIFMKTFRALLPKTSGIRRSGSAALDLAHVAAGRFDGFWELGLKPWDMAAGVLLIQEAGGLVTDFDGEQKFMKSGNIIAANRYLFNNLLEIIRSRTQTATAQR